MTREQWFKTQKEFFDSIIEVGRAKNADYTAKSDNPFANFELVETLGITTTETGFLTRMFDKFQRLKSFALNGKLEVENEGLTDALKDLAGYCSLWYGYALSKSEKQDRDKMEIPDYFFEPEKDVDVEFIPRKS